MSSQLPAAIVLSLEHIRIYKYLQVSSVVILVFDYLLTVPREIELVWKQKRTLVTLLFLFTRYTPFFDAALTLFEEIATSPAPSTCKSIFIAQSWLYLIGILVAAGILILRTYAIWDNSVRVASSLLILLAGLFSGAGFFLQRYLVSLVLSTSPSREAFPGCFVKQSDRLVGGFFYLFMLLFETVIFVMTLYKSLRNSKQNTSAVVRTVYRDGIVFYAYLLCVSIVNIAVINAAPPELQTCMTGIHRVLHAVLSERIILNIRSALSTPLQPSPQNLGGQESEESYTLQDLQFTKPPSTAFRPTTMSRIDVTGLPSSSSFRSFRSGSLRFWTQSGQGRE